MAPIASLVSIHHLMARGGMICLVSIKDIRWPWIIMFICGRYFGVLAL